MNKFIVLDTETTWDNRVMSIGAVVADAQTYQPIDAKYYILNPEYRAGGMFSYALINDEVEKPLICSREKAIKNLLEFFTSYNVK